MLLGGPIVCITMALFFYIENGRLQQACLLLGLSASLAMVLVVILSLDSPYAGYMAISADAYQLIYDHHMR